MMIQFRFSNFRSFKDEALLSMEKTNLKESDQLKENSFKIDDKLELLKTAVIYGANASGKSNIFKALSFFKNFVLNSILITNGTQVESFKLNTSSEREPSLFEMIFTIDSQIYRYGFKCDFEQVHEEWLYERPIAKNAKERKLFVRKEQRFERGSFFKEGKAVEDKTRNNALFLTALSQWNSPTASKILKYIGSLTIIFLDSMPLINIGGIFDNKNNVSRDFLEYSKAADFNIKDMKKIEKNVDENNPEDKIAIKIKNLIKPEIASEDMKKIEIQIFHEKFDENHKSVDKEIPFDLLKNESMGTIKFISLLSNFAKRLSEENLVIFVDELDSSLHPLLLEFIIKLFNSSESNRNNSQLICSMHDLQVLDSDLLRRDQIWFTEKNKFGESSLYSLADFKTNKVRKSQNYSKNYLFGRYGAVPNIKSFVKEQER